MLAGGTSPGGRGMRSRQSDEHHAVWVRGCRRGEGLGRGVDGRRQGTAVEREREQDEHT